jgi:hypothetical protein
VQSAVSEDRVLVEREALGEDPYREREVVDQRNLYEVPLRVRAHLAEGSRLPHRRSF